MKLKTKLLVSFMLAAWLPVLVVGVVSYKHDVTDIAANVQENVDMFKAGVKEHVRTRQVYIEGVGRQVAANGGVVAGMAAGDQEAIKRIADDLLRQSGDNLTFITFVSADGVVVARALNDKAGDSVKDNGYFKTAITGKEFLGIEAGSVNKLPLRGAYPIIDPATKATLGVVSLGYSLASLSLVDFVKNAYGIECTIFEGETRVATTIKKPDGERAVGTPLNNPAIAKAVLTDGQMYQGRNVILGQNYDTAYWPIVGANGQNVGICFIGLPSAAAEASMRQALISNLVVVVLVGGLMVLMGWFTARRISGPLSNSVDMLTGSIEQVMTAVESLNATCGVLAASSQRQAESLTESSTALEELSAQAKSNVETSDKAAGFMGKTEAGAQAANGSMKEMVVTMEDIRKSSDQVAGIIKTIEDIAFQTNLLALNAAVEAARAGDQGQGFAVVAEEVRNLAMRSSEAARSTSGLITESVGYARKGENAAGKVSENIDGTLSNMVEVSALLKEVSTASTEQSTGISEISAAVHVMDQALHEVVSASNDAAGAARLLSVQANQMEEVMLVLARMVDQKKAASLMAHRRPMENRGPSEPGPAPARIAKLPR